MKLIRASLFKSRFMSIDDATYLRTALDPIRVCAHYKSKFEQGAASGGVLTPSDRSDFNGRGNSDGWRLDIAVANTMPTIFQRTRSSTSCP